MPILRTEQLFWVITEVVIMPLESHEVELTLRHVGLQAAAFPNGSQFALIKY